MKKVKLNYIQCANSGYNGLLIDGMNNYSCDAAMDGVLVAHDLLEHVNSPNQIGSISDELEALGVTWWIRGCFNDLSRERLNNFRSPYDIFADDISYMADFIAGGTSPPKKIRTYSSDYDEDFKLFVKTAKKNFYSDDRSIYTDQSNLDQYFDCAIHYLRVGYRKALKRFKRIGQFGANSLFWKLAEQVDAEFQDLSLDDYLDVSYCLTTGEVHTTVKYNSF